MAIPTVSNEEIPPLDGQRVLAVGEIAESESETVTLAGPSNQGGRAPRIKGKANASGGSEMVKKTPLPWNQFSIILFLQLAEPLASQVIYPVSS